MFEKLYIKGAVLKYENLLPLKVHVPPSVHGNNGVAMLHSPGVVQYSPKRSASVTEVTSRGVSSSPSDASPCGSPVKKFAAVNERSNKPTPTQLPWTHIKIQTQPKGTKSFFTVWISFSTPVLLILKCKF